MHGEGEVLGPHLIWQRIAAGSKVHDIVVVDWCGAMNEKVSVIRACHAEQRCDTGTGHDMYLLTTIVMDVATVPSPPLPHRTAPHGKTEPNRVVDGWSERMCETEPDEERRVR